MSLNPLILSIDQGTTSSRAILFEKNGQSRFTAQLEFRQIFPQSGWVEHDPEEIWSTTLSVTREAIAASKNMGRPIASIGITNQRETTVVWERGSGKPIYNAIVWQDRRTAAQCNQLKQEGHEQTVKDKTGLLLDPYFSGTKIAWILDNVAGARDKANQGDLAFGTVDSFLLWRLTHGTQHTTDATNAARTLLFNIHTNRWDEELLSLLNVPSSVLPEVKDCSAQFGQTSKALLGESLPICGMAGDQQAAAFGQACFQTGMTKSTYGTGCFVLINTGETPIASNNRLLTTVGYRLNGETSYATEGSIFVAGAAIQWLRDGLGLIKSAEETEAIAQTTEHNQGVYMIPAFTGLGAPHWDADARGALFGLTRGTGIKEIVRATLESVCYQTNDLFCAMTDDGIHPTHLRVDGGMVRNDWLCQFLTDILEITVQRPMQTETTALGAAYLAGLQCGVYDSFEDLEDNWVEEATFSPSMDQDLRLELIHGWDKAIRRVRSDYQ
ncbi:glycerol kinase GlpK [Sedimenticola selenatireducens]|uniref:Glycerol kinase n=1 Tax=Sedimenticola selenatireducens TaxID=191960 RepID=A0A557RZA8_9GAMM|nr:glycerol kinase GlpK [Sedimenticola selenatireducens]TVO70469.1 glycerol kinase GlpK [Sedimenticola selenatireducens]TVT63046.1 MAG: glycerol kinase GlpK [Sedimenticola selenatireducens]